MKILFCVVLISLLSFTSGWIPWRSYGSCVDCRMQLVGPGQSYYDGCNRCTCIRWFPTKQAACTYMACEWNRCFKP